MQVDDISKTSSTYYWVRRAMFSQSSQGATQTTNGRQQKHVTFGSVNVREYPMTLGENPATGIGAPVCLDWEYHEHPAVSVDENPHSKHRHRNPHRNTSPHTYYLNYYKRKSILEGAGFSEADQKQAERRCRWEQARRKMSKMESFLPLWIKKWKVTYGRIKAEKFVETYRREHHLAGKKRRHRPRVSLNESVNPKQDSKMFPPVNS